MADIVGDGDRVSGDAMKSINGFTYRNNFSAARSQGV